MSNQPNHYDPITPYVFRIEMMPNAYRAGNIGLYRVLYHTRDTLRLKGEGRVFTAFKHQCYRCADIRAFHVTQEHLAAFQDALSTMAIFLNIIGDCSTKEWSGHYLPEIVQVDNPRSRTNFPQVVWRVPSLTFYQSTHITSKMVFADQRRFMQDQVFPIAAPTQHQQLVDLRAAAMERLIEWERYISCFHDYDPLDENRLSAKPS